MLDAMCEESVRVDMAALRHKLGATIDVTEACSPDESQPDCSRDADGLMALTGVRGAQAGRHVIGLQHARRLTPALEADTQRATRRTYCISSPHGLPHFAELAQVHAWRTRGAEGFATACIPALAVMLRTARSSSEKGARLHPRAPRERRKTECGLHGEGEGDPRRDGTSDGTSCKRREGQIIV